MRRYTYRIWPASCWSSSSFTKMGWRASRVFFRSGVFAASRGWMMSDVVWASHWQKLANMAMGYIIVNNDKPKSRIRVTERCLHVILYWDYSISWISTGWKYIIAKNQLLRFDPSHEGSLCQSAHELNTCSISGFLSNGTFSRLWAECRT